MSYKAYPAAKQFRKKALEVTPTRFIREIPPEFLDDEAVKKHDECKEEYVADFFESMRKRFADKGLTATVKSVGGLES